MGTAKENKYDYYSPFDLKKHKETYIDYLEVVILEDGTVEYAVPSHQLKLMAIAEKKLGKTREEILDLCPPEMYGDFNQWLCEITNTISVWCWFHIGYCNKAQNETLRQLKEHGLYYGEIQNKKEEE